MLGVRRHGRPLLTDIMNNIAHTTSGTSHATSGTMHAIQSELELNNLSKDAYLLRWSTKSMPTVRKYSEKYPGS
jgi:hypothetical protein